MNYVGDKNIFTMLGYALLFKVSQARLDSSWCDGSSDRPIDYFSFHPVIHDWCNKGCGMYYPVCGMMHIKEPLLLIEKSSLSGSSGFPLSLSEWSLL